MNIFGWEDRFLNFYAKCLRVLPGIPYILRGTAKIQPVHVFFILLYLFS